MSTLFALEGETKEVVREEMVKKGDDLTIIYGATCHAGPQNENPDGRAVLFFTSTVKGALAYYTDSQTTQIDALDFILKGYGETGRLDLSTFGSYVVNCLRDPAARKFVKKKLEADPPALHDNFHQYLQRAKQASQSQGST